LDDGENEQNSREIQRVGGAKEAGSREKGDKKKDEMKKREDKPNKA